MRNESNPAGNPGVCRVGSVPHSELDVNEHEGPKPPVRKSMMFGWPASADQDLPWTAVKSSAMFMPSARQMR